VSVRVFAVFDHGGLLCIGGTGNAELTKVSA
jgi:hypothetical protein